MKATSLNNSINAINNVRMLHNELRDNLFLMKKQRELEKNFIKKSLSMIF